MNAWAKGLPQKDIKELELLLSKKFGENLSGDKITHTVIKQVLKKGKIENEESYRVIYEYLQDIFCQFGYANMNSWCGFANRT